ncbi:MAG: biotin/lipoyl-containing protein [Candidatus Methylomirabilales bacterium]
MAYIARWGDEEHKVEVVATGAPWQVKVGEAIHQVDVLDLGGGLYSLIIDGKSYEVDVLEEGEAFLVLVEGRAFRLELQEERRRAFKAARAKEVVGRQVMTAPIPSKVVKIFVSVGDQVKAGDGVIVLEAMKMENELKALGPGIVREIKVQEGQGVGGGEVLVVIE